MSALAGEYKEKQAYWERLVVNSMHLYFCRFVF